MNYTNIETPDELARFCEQIRDEPLIGFDTEFVAEDSYRTELCLIQVTAGSHLAIIDTIACRDVEPFWRVLAAPGHETLVHAGREEFRFCHNAIGQRPCGWFDIQLAAGMVGMEFPAAYSTLVSRVLGESLKKGETRTDWRRRPLTQRQIDYALLDVVYLTDIHAHLVKRLTEMERLAWLREELELWQSNLEHVGNTEQWRRVSGIAGLNARQLAIVRELWRWRESEAEQRNRPAKRILRDDLIIELSRRQTAAPDRIRAIRGLERRDIQKHVGSLAKAIDRALRLPDDECPRPPRRNNRQPLTLLGQFLATALSAVCRESQIAPNLVGGAQDIRDLVAFRLNLDKRGTDELPALAKGWRADVVGHTIDELLAGEIAVRVESPLSDQPLALERRE